MNVRGDVAVADESVGGMPQTIRDFGLKVNCGRKNAIVLRFILPLLLVLGVVAYSVVLVDSLTLKWFTRDSKAGPSCQPARWRCPGGSVVSRSARKFCVLS